MESAIEKIIHSQSSFYSICAWVGTGMFILQILLMIFGGDGDEDMDGRFKWLSKQASTGFLMIFGWTGQTCLHQFHCHPFTTAFFATLAGFSALCINIFLFKGARKLKSSGTVFRIEETIGKQALVYQTIPAGGSGKITVSLNHFNHELEAISDVSFALPSFSSVKICKIVNKTTVVVVPN